MKFIAALTLPIILCACTQKVATTAVGEALPSVPIQAAEQCKAQPELAWCKNADH